MPDRGISVKKIAFAVAGAAAVMGALVFLFFAAFPYFYAESGSARYARDHRGEAMLQVIAAGLLLGLAWLFIRHSFSGRTWMIIVGVLIALGVVRCGASYTRIPQSLQAVGGNWHVVVTHEPEEIDTVRYHVYFRRGAHYQSIEDLAGEYHFVRPDCLTYRGLKVVGRPMYAMCGYRMPVESYDTTVSEADLLARARARPKYRTDWQLSR